MKILKGHGADIYSASLNMGVGENDIVDFSSNINPLALPDGIGEAIKASLQHINRYPDINNRKLVESISKYEGVKEEAVFCSNGASEAIYRIPIFLKPKNALITAPTFSEYEKALNTMNCNISYYNLLEENNYKVQEDILHEAHKMDIIFICNPNNPTGQVTDNILLEKIIKNNEKTIVVVDECFIDFVENKNNYSVKNLLNKYNNLIILKAFTKIFAMPGIRLGYLLCNNPEIIQGLKKSGPPWNISNIAQAAGISALKENKYLNNTSVYIKEQRNYLTSELKKLKIHVYESFGNYILFKYMTPNLKEELLKKNILIRSCSNYKNLSPNHYRIAVRNKEDNIYLINSLKEIIK